MTALIEKDLNSALQWLICLFPLNAPLRHLFRELDGKTKGPNEFGGVSSKQLENCNVLPVVKFLPIQQNLPIVKILEDLSTDQKYLLEMCTPISSGAAHAFQICPLTLKCIGWNAFLKLRNSENRNSYQKKLNSKFRLFG